MGVSQPLRLLVDSRVHAEELARFEALVVRGRAPTTARSGRARSAAMVTAQTER